VALKYSLANQVDAINRHDVDAFMAHYAPEALVRDPFYPEPLKGKDAIRKDMVDFFRAFPDLRFTIATVVESGDRVAFEGNGTGTHKGPLAGPAGEIPPTNRRVEFAFAGFLRVTTDGLVAEEHRYMDTGLLMQQLGLG
jgi:steroid delta-isomerase-like uncharacterized protein